MLIRNNKKHQTHVPSTTDDDQPKVLHPGQIIAGRFKLIEKVGQGSFGSIYKTENVQTGEICATKFEKDDHTKNQIGLIVREIKVLMELKDLEGFPKLHYYGRDDHHKYFMMSYLGQNLEYLIRKTKSFSSITCLKLSLQLLDRIESFHKKNLIHRDLKPENIVIGWQDIDQVYLIDFGLAKYYRDSNGNHIPMVEKKGIIGTARYASINAHLGREQSRKDDLESLAYVLIYINKGKLPWMNLVIQDKAQKYQKILEQKQTISNERLCENLPKCYYLLLQHSKTREFTEDPNYPYLKEQFQKALFELETIETFAGFDWEQLPELKQKRKRDRQISKQKRLRSSEKKMGEKPVVQPAIQEKKSQVSFLIVPELDGVSPERQMERRSRGYNSHNSYGTTKLMNYQISQLHGEEGEMYKKYVSQVSVKRKDSKSFTTGTGQKVQLQPAAAKRSTFFKEASAAKKQEVDEDYLSFDDIDQLAEEESHNLNIQSLGAFKFKKLGNFQL